jgi:hypothetical protein
MIAGWRRALQQRGASIHCGAGLQGYRPCSFLARGIGLGLACAMCSAVLLRQTPVSASHLRWILAISTKFIRATNSNSACDWPWSRASTPMAKAIWMPAGPAPLAIRRDGAAVVIDFDQALTVFGAARPTGFELCYTTGCRFVEASVEGKSVRIDDTSPDPLVKVRYAWADSPIVLQSCTAPVELPAETV